MRVETKKPPSPLKEERVEVKGNLNK